MTPSRRAVLAALGAFGLPLPAAAQARAFWPLFRDRFVTSEGRALDTGNGGVSHTEGQSYAMLFAEAAGDRESFERLWSWTDGHLSRPDMRLFSWRFDPRADPPVADPNNATDGDLVIAWALMRAARRWDAPRHAATARDIRAAVAANLVVDAATGPVLLPGLNGFRKDATVTLNPSYYVWPALDAFAAAEPDGPWRALAAAGEALLSKARFGVHALPADWISLDADGQATPAAGWPPRFGYDAVRTPLYLAWSGRSALLEPFRAYWGPRLKSGAAPPAWIDVATGQQADYAAPPGMLAVARWVCGSPPSPADWGGDYYSTALAGLVALGAAEV